MRWLMIISLLIVIPAPAANASCCACLPKGIKRSDIVSRLGFKPGMNKGKQTITVEEKLATLKARCRRGKLIDGSGKQIYFYQLTGCWGNPPTDYQEILDKQNTELIRLRKRYTVIEMTCMTSAEPIQ